MRFILVIGALGLGMTTASAYDGFSPLSGPNTAIPSPVCDIINFGFCPQPAPPPPLLPDPNAVAAAPSAPTAPRVRHHRQPRHHPMPAS